MLTDEDIPLSIKGFPKFHNYCGMGHRRPELLLTF
jgi:hypothetical protein